MMVSALLFLSACQGKTPTGGLEVVITTSGLQVGVDFDAIEGEVEQQTPTGSWNKLFDRSAYVPSEVTLPTTMAIEPGTSPDEDALITVTALKQGLPIAQRIVQLQIPTNRVAELLMILAGDCLGKVGLCPAGESCQPASGMCGSNVVDPNMLATYPSPLDAGTFPDGGSSVTPDATSTGGAEGSNDASASADVSGDASGAGNMTAGPIPSAGCGKALTVAMGMWVAQPTSCPSPSLTGGYTVSNNNQGTAACQAIPPGSTVPAVATEGSPEYRGWWVYVPNGYDPTKPHTVIYNGVGCEDSNFFTAGMFGYPYYDVDDGQAILVGLDYDTYAGVPGCYDTGDPKSNDLVFMPWLMNEIESTLCVDTTREWMSEYNNTASSLAQQFDCALPAKLRGQVLVGGSEPGAASYSPALPLGALPPCNPSPTAAFFVRDFNDKDNPYANILPGCARVLRQNGCSTTTCDPLDETLTTPYPVPAGVTLPPGATCVKFKGCPAEYPVVFCVTYDQNTGGDQSWGVVTMFWDFISGMPSASALCPAGQGYESGTCAPCHSAETLCGVVCVNEQADVNNCGGCGVGCPLGGSCQSGVCACPSGDAVCRNVCVNQQTDPTNCGGCGTACPTGGSCQNASCVCPAGQSACAAPGACVDERTDPNNCGGCGVACATGGSSAVGQSCEGGICGPCPVGETVCNGSCVDEQVDMSDCGTCGNECAPDAFCQQGVCTN
jgi:hypothetical protein